MIDFRVATSFAGIDPVAAARNIILVRPSGLVDGTIPYWLAAKTDPPGHDVVFISDLLDLLEAELCIDPSRVYSTGIANDAQMSSPLACELGDRIAAVAPVAGPSGSFQTPRGNGSFRALRCARPSLVDLVI